MSQTSRFDLVVIGAGSGGFAAALAGARGGLKVALVERADSLGGNAARGGINSWEMGVGGTGFPFEIYKRLKKVPQTVGIYRLGRHLWTDPTFPGGEAVLDPTLRYVDSLRRFLHPGEDKFQVWHGVPFEPGAYARVLCDLLDETGNVTVLTGTGFRSAVVSDRRIVEITLTDGSVLRAETFVDATGDLELAQATGCKTRIGREDSSTYGETAAPEEANSQINAITQIYRVNPSDGPQTIEQLPADVPPECWWREKFPVAMYNQYPAGGWNINMLPTMEGREYLSLGPAAAQIECRRRVLAHWHWVQTKLPEMQGFRLSWMAPALGVRETHRLVGRYVLTQHDLDATLKAQTHEDIICIADHAKDVHGEAHVAKELTFPYGVPYRCLLPVELDNLLVACRGASFSAIGASSCRLSRTMLQLGQAAGTAAALAKERGDAACAVPAVELRSRLRNQGVQLEWPALPALQSELENE